MKNKIICEDDHLTPLVCFSPAKNVHRVISGYFTCNSFSCLALKLEVDETSNLIKTVTWVMGAGAPAEPYFYKRPWSWSQRRSRLRETIAVLMLEEVEHLAEGTSGRGNIWQGEHLAEGTSGRGNIWQREHLTGTSSQQSGSRPQRHHQAAAHHHSCC